MSKFCQIANKITNCTDNCKQCLEEIDREKIEHYLGITDNTDTKYKDKVIAEYEEMKQRYPNCEYALTEDLGIYIPYTEIVATGKYISVFIKGGN